MVHITMVPNIGDMVTIRNGNPDTITGHTVTAYKVIDYRNGCGSILGRNHFGKIAWFTVGDIIELKNKERM